MVSSQLFARQRCQFVFGASEERGDGGDAREPPRARGCCALGFGGGMSERSEVNIPVGTALYVQMPFVFQPLCISN